MPQECTIEPAVSEWASPTFLVSEEDIKLRFFVDYRTLNAMSVRNTYPLPQMHECTDSLGGAAIFSLAECKKWY